MRTKLTAVAVSVAMAITLAAVAAAEPVSVRQRVAINQAKTESFVLTPLTSGAIQRDSGTFAACCWSSRHAVRDGQDIDLNDPEITLTGKRGTLVVRNQIGFVDIPGGIAVFTGTWKVVGGTGDYAALSGGGRVAGLKLANGNTRARFEGFLGPK